MSRVDLGTPWDPWDFPLSMLDIELLVVTALPARVVDLVAYVWGNARNAELPLKISRILNGRLKKAYEHLTMCVRAVLPLWIVATALECLFTLTAMYDVTWPSGTGMIPQDKTCVLRNT